MTALSKEELIAVSYDEDGIGYLEMADIPGKNALTPGFVELLIECLKSIKTNDDLKVLIIKGSSEIFCSGADLDTLIKLCKRELKPVDIILSKLILDIPIPVIAAMEG